MHVSKWVLVVNGSAISINVLVWLLAILKVCTSLLLVLIMGLFLVGAILASAKAQGKVLFPKAVSFHAAPTEKMKSL